jgi:hypothetical protein
MVADVFQNATRRNVEPNLKSGPSLSARSELQHSTRYVPVIPPTPVNPLSFAASESAANSDLLNPSSASTVGRNVSSPDPGPITNPPIQDHNHARSFCPKQSIHGRGQLKATKKTVPSAEISTSTALPSSEAQSTLTNPLPSRHSRKRTVSDGPSISSVAKKQRTEPLPESSRDLFYRKSGPKLQVRLRSDWLGMPSKGDQERKGRRKGKRKIKGQRKGDGKRSGERKGQPKETTEATPPMDEVDQVYLDAVLKKIKLASFRENPQQIECTIGKDGICDLDVTRPPRSTGIGQMEEGDSVYFIFLSQIENKFLCWICGHTMTTAKQLRALGHVRTHFEHRPFHCNVTIVPDTGEKTPCGWWVLLPLRRLW